MGNDVNTEKNEAASQQLEQELLDIWRGAANTRKVTSQRRIEHILRNSRAELSLRDLLQFSLHLLRACISLFSMFSQILFTPDTLSTQPEKAKAHE